MKSQVKIVLQSTRMENTAKKVHFSPSSTRSLDATINDGTQTNHHFNLVLSICSLLIASVAIGGCLLLYFELMEVSGQVQTQQKRLFGETKNNKNHGFEQPNVGWIKEFLTRNKQMESNLEEIKIWINISGCLEDQDFVIKYVQWL